MSAAIFGRCTEPKLQVFCWRNDALLRAPSSTCVPRSHHHLPRPLARDPGRHGAQRQQRPVRPAGLGDGGGLKPEVTESLKETGSGRESVRHNGDYTTKRRGTIGLRHSVGLIRCLCSMKIEMHMMAVTDESCPPERERERQYIYIYEYDE